FKPGLVVSKAIGKFKLELSTGVTFFTNNNDFFGGNTLEQDPIYSVQAHVSYDFGRGMWAGVDGTYYLGARTTINGTSENNMQENSRVGITFALPVNKHNSIKLYVSTGLSTRTGSNSTTGGIAWQYRCGGGLCRCLRLLIGSCLLRSSYSARACCRRRNHRRLLLRQPQTN